MEAESVELMVAVSSCLGLVPNIFVILLIICQNKGRKRSILFLTLFLSLISILVLCQGIMYFVDISKHSEGSFCPLVVYVRNCLISLVALTVLCISRERTEVLQSRPPSGVERNNKVFIVIGGIVGFSLIFAIPTLYSARYVQHQHFNGSWHSACLKGPLLGNLYLGAFYELARFILFHLALSICLLYELYKIRAKLKYLNFLQPLPSRRVKKARRTRFLFINSLIFIIIWLPFGFIQSAYTILRDRDKISHFSSTSIEEEDDSQNTSRNKHPFAYYFIICVIYLYIILLPVTLYATHNNVKRQFGKVWKRKRERRNLSVSYTKNATMMEQSETVNSNIIPQRNAVMSCGNIKIIVTVH